MAETKQKGVQDSVQVTVVGRIGTEVESRETKGGKRISSCRMAVGQSKKNAAGHWEDGETMWFKLVCFGSDIDEFVKGDKVRVVGRLTMNTWEGRSGDTMTTWEILVSDKVSPEVLGKPKPKAPPELEAQDEYPE